jgi:hypothetical protein
MAADYLEYLEHTATAEPPPSTLTRIAHALKMSMSDLLGGEMGSAEGRAGPARDPEMVKLDEAHCREFLTGGGVGRVVFRTSEGPVALPVNFEMLAGDVIFRSAEKGAIAAIRSEEPVSFEIDRIDTAMGEGWSVLASGTIQPIRGHDQLREVEALGIQPWAGGKRHTYFRLSVTGLTGRSIIGAR